MNVGELEGAALDAAVAKAEGLESRKQNGLSVTEVFNKSRREWVHFEPSDDWRIGGPIIEREGIDLCAPSSHEKAKGPWQWVASAWRDGYVEYEQIGPTPLIAAMRAYVASSLRLANDDCT